MNRNIVIELSETALNKVREVVASNENEQVAPLKASELPTEKVELLTKNYFTSIERMRADLLPMAILQNPKKIPVIEELIQNYAKAPIKVVVKAKDNVVEVKAFTTFNHELLNRDVPLLHFISGSHMDAPQLFDCEYSSQPHFCEMKADEMCGILREVFEFLNKPTTIKTVEDVREAVATKQKPKKKVARKKPKVRYVYKTIHKIANINTEDSGSSRRPYSEREWNKEEWTRQGHYRTYRSKTTGQIIKQIWIEPTVCRAHGKVKQTQNLKITKMD